VAVREVERAGKGMSRDGGIALTQIGNCLNTRCRAPVFAELQMPDAPQLCHDCAPLLIKRQIMFRNLFERSGGRLPADYSSNPHMLAVATSTAICPITPDP
jgi:hypothetical protein